eukprot:1195439-Prorocentrum_minimum.AAC.3
MEGSREGVRTSSSRQRPAVACSSEEESDNTLWRGLEGVYARKPQDPINSEEYQGHLQGGLYAIWRGLERGFAPAPRGSGRRLPAALEEESDSAIWRGLEGVCTQFGRV